MRQRISGTRLIFLAGFLVSWTESFVAVPAHRHGGSPHSTEFRPVTTTLTQTNDDAEESSFVKKDESSSIPLLPHFGSSSQSTFNPFDGTLPHLQPQEDTDPAVKKYVANRKFELQYTCNVCDTRNCHKVSRVAYRKGVVIATCKGCQSQHLISDGMPKEKNPMWLSTHKS